MWLPEGLFTFYQPDSIKTGMKDVGHPFPMTICIHQLNVHCQHPTMLELILEALASRQHADVECEERRRAQNM